MEPPIDRQRCDCGVVMTFSKIATKPDESLRQNRWTTADASTVWHHASTKQNWFDKVRGKDTVIHFGSVEAALSRADSVYMEISRPVYLHSFRIDASKISGTILTDLDHWPESLRTDVPSANLYDLNNEQIMHASDVTGYPYFNVYESPGNISIVSTPDVVIAESVTITRLACW